MSVPKLPQRTHLAPHEKGAMLVIDPSLLHELGINDTSAVSLTVSSGTLVVTPLPPDERRARFEAAKKDTFEKYDDVFRRLAE